MKKLALGLALALLIFSCKKKPNAPQRPEVAVIYHTVQQLEVNPSHKIVGRVIAPKSVNLQARVEGLIIKKNFSAGQEVKKGDLLFQIEQDIYAIKVKELEAQLNQAQTQSKLKSSIFKRMDILNKKKAVAQQEFDTSLSERDEAIATVALVEAQLADAKLKLKWTSIAAPFDGRTGITTFTEGDLVKPSTGTLMTIIKSDEMEVEFDLNEKLFVQGRMNSIAKEKKGEAKVKKIDLVDTKLILPTGDEYEHQGKISFWDNRIDPSTATVKMRALFPNPHGLLVDGMYARLKLSKSISEKALLVPQNAILQDQGGHYVITVNEKEEAIITRITLGGEYDGSYMVESGIKAGDRVISEGLQKVIPGNKVKAVPAPKADGNK